MSNIKDNIQGYNLSLKKLIKGINKVGAIIRPTYGPYGSNVIIEETALPGHRIANDGKIITDSIQLSDAIEQMGVNILKEACEKQEKEAGDGRKTTIILTSSILNEGLKYKDHVAPLEMKRQLDQCLPLIIEKIDGKKREISVKDIGKIAEIAAESEEIGKIIGEIYPKIGREGIIEIESAGIPGTFYEIVDGVRLHGAKMFAGWQSEPDLCVIEDARIIVCKDKIASVGQIEPLYAKLQTAGVKEVVLYCEDIDMGVVSRLALNTVKSFNGDYSRTKTLIVKAPVLWKDWIYEDLCLMTGAIAIDSKEGRTFNNFEISQLGRCGKWRATQIDSRLNDTRNISDHIKKLKEKGKKDDQLILRANWLNTKVAVLKIGANSESELSWKMKKTKDACHASYYALKDGVVTGAGIAYGDIPIDSLPDNIAGKILRKALFEPSKQLSDNSKGAIDSNNTEDIFDPAIVVKSAITNAISIAGIVLTTKGAITIPDLLKQKMDAYAKKMTQI